METTVEQQTHTNLKPGIIVNSTFLIATGVVGVSTFLAAMTLPALPVAHSTGSLPSTVRSFEECLPYGEIIREETGLVCIYKNERYPQL